MPNKTIRCEIVSAKEQLFSGDVEMVIVSGLLGELGILPGHTPLLTSLKPGAIRLKSSAQGDAQTEQIFYASGGFIEVQPTSVTILSDTTVRADDLDEAAVKEAQAKAKQMLEDQTDDFQFGLAAARLAEAAAQLRALERFRNQRR